MGLTPPAYFEQYKKNMIPEYQVKPKQTQRLLEMLLEYMFSQSHATSQAQSLTLVLPNTFASAECLCICNDQLLYIQVL